jgi:hypothetical protein
MDRKLYVYATHRVSIEPQAYNDEQKTILLDHILRLNPPSRHGYSSSFELVHSLLDNQANANLAIFGDNPLCRHTNRWGSRIMATMLVGEPRVISV